MARSDIILPAPPTDALPVVRSLRVEDLRDALRKGMQDFWVMPTHIIFLFGIYPIVGLLIFRITFVKDLLPILFPLAAGFALIGPFAAIGLYELSRRRELGLDTSWRHAFDILRSPAMPSILALGLTLMVIFLCWLTTAQALYEWLFGPFAPQS